MPLLSICIATFNRADLIGETLDSIIPQLGADVELLIVDGASTDDTAAVIALRAAGHPAVRYVRLPAKGGFDRDYCLAVQAARGTYVWLFGDDDLIRPGAVARVVSALRTGLELLILNAEIRDTSLTRQIDARRNPARVDVVYRPHEMDRLFVEQAGFLTFVGAIVMRRSTWLARSPEPWLGSDFVHVGIIFAEPLSGDALAVAEPDIIIRYGNAQWKTRAFEVWMIQWPQAVARMNGVSAQARARVSGPAPWRRLRALVHSRAMGTFGWPQYERLVAAYPTSAAWQLGAAVISASPQSVLRQAVAWYFRTVREASALERYDLESAKSSRLGSS